MRVVIVGAGLGGLALAHGLRDAGVAVGVHERGPRSGSQPASYGIHLGPAAHRALHACLPAPNWDRYDRTSAAAPDTVRFRGPDLDVLAERRPGDPLDAADPVAHRRAVRRDALYGALVEGLDDVVRWESRYVDHEVTPAGLVRVTFADGSVVEADVLVGADGSNSGVRRRSRPEIVRRELGVVNVAGRLPLDDPAVRALPPGMTDGSVNNVVPAGPGWLFASTWPASGGDHDDGGVLVWAYAAARSSWPDDVEDRPAADLRRLVADRIAGWDPRLGALVDRTDVRAVAPVVLRSTGELPRRTATPVTLLGDAAHTMSPMAGVGAATALRDADALRRALLADGPVEARVEAYEEEMRGYANRALRLSTRNTRAAGSSARVPRLAFRTLLRVGDAVAPARRVSAARR